MGRLSKTTLPKRNYVESFRVVAWQFLLFRDALDELAPDYDRCPLVCGKGIEVEQDEYCKGCDVKIAETSFKEDTTKFLDERVGPVWKEYGFNILYNDVLNIYNLKEREEDHPSHIDHLINVLQGEINRKDRIKEWNRKMEAKKK